MVLPKPHPYHGDTQLGGISQAQNLTLRSEGFVSHNRYSNHWDLHQRDKAPKHLVLKNNRAYIQGPRKL